MNPRGLLEGLEAKVRVGVGGKRHEVIILEGDENALFQFKRKDAYKTTVRKKVLLTEKGIANFLCKTFTYIDYSLFIEQRANSFLRMEH